MAGSLGVRVSGLVFVGALVVACGTSTGGTDGGATPADGGGVCCPIRGSTCSAGGGGWRANASECNDAIIYDAWLETTIDSHGCAALVENRSKCCGCPSPKDSGPDGASDAQTDAPTDAPDGS